MKFFFPIMFLLIVSGCIQVQTVSFEEGVKEIDSYWIESGFSKPFLKSTSFSDYFNDSNVDLIASLTKVRHKLMSFSTDLEDNADENSLALIELVDIHLSLVDLYSARWDFSNKKDLNDIFLIDTSTIGAKEVCASTGELKDFKIKGDILYLAGLEVNSKLDKFYKKNPKKAELARTTPFTHVFIGTLGTWINTFGSYVKLQEKTCLLNSDLKKWWNEFSIMLQKDPCEHFNELNSTINKGQSLLSKQDSLITELEVYLSKNNSFFAPIKTDFNLHSNPFRQKLIFIKNLAKKKCKKN